MNKELPACLMEKSQLRYTVVFSLLVAFLAIILIQPYSHNVWFSIGPHTSVGYTLGFLSLVSLFVVVDKIIMYNVYRKHHFSVLTYIVWTIAEIILIALAYSLVTIKLVEMGEVSITNPNFGDVFTQALLHTLLVLGGPYLICAFYFIVQDKDKTIRLMNYSNVVSDTEQVPSEQKKINLFDNEGVLKLSVNLKNILFIESDDNYIKVWYEDSHGVLKQYMLRCRLKTVEESFEGSDLVRCHRKYIVNISKVQVLSKEKDGYVLDLERDEIGPIAVSRTYESAVLSKFNSR